MKKFIIFSSLVCACFSVNAQTLQAVTDNGASTSNTLNSFNPNGFQVTGTVGSPAYMVIDQTSNSGGKRWRFGHTGGAPGFGSFDISNVTDGITPLSMMSNGNVGIGTVNPQSKFHIYQSAQDQAGLVVQGNTINSDNAQHYVAITLDGDYGNGTGNYSQIRSYSNLHYYWGSRLAFFTTSSGGANTLLERMRIDASGNVGIGTTAPNSKLAVNGNIRAHEIKVETANWPDYVFAKDYELPTLQETEKHIKDKGHLPGIPSAAEVIANGVDLGEMNAKLLQKLEELTLHLIRLEKENEGQSKELKEQKEQIRQLINRK